MLSMIEPVDSAGGVGYILDKVIKVYKFPHVTYPVFLNFCIYLTYIVSLNMETAHGITGCGR